MELVQSFLLSVMRVRLSVYEQRIITRIVEHGQPILQGLSRSQYKHVKNPFENEEIAVKIRYILTDGTKDYRKVVDACKALMHRQFEFYEPTSKTYYMDTVIHNVRHVERSGEVRFMVSKVFFEVMYNFSLGYKNYDLETALNLPTPFAVRMYALLNNQEHPITWSIEKLKAMFGVADKYKQTADFIKKVIEPARKALVAQSVNNFTYHRETEGQKVVALTFFPVKVDERARKMFADLSKEQITQVMAVRMYLAEYVGFTAREISCNKKTIEDFARIPDATAELAHIDKRAKRKDGVTKGYYVNAMRSAFKEYGQAVKRVPRKEPH